MNKDQVIAVVKKYSDALSFRGIKSERHLDLEVDKCSVGDLLQHVRWMCDEMIILMAEYDEHVEKIMRWLGFVQGVLWSTGFYSIEQMKNDNR